MTVAGRITMLGINADNTTVNARRPPAPPLATVANDTASPIR